MKNFKKYFLSQVNKTSGCWLWNGSIQPNGYGRFHFGYKQISAHRQSYILFKGEIGKNGWILHKCDVRHCVNPKHLYQGTAKDNARDTSQRKRWAYGERNGWSKLSDSQREEIKMAKLKGGRYWGAKEFAKKFGVQLCTIVKTASAIRKLKGEGAK